MKRHLTLLYGILCYLLYLGTMAYFIGFLANFGVPKSIDSGPVSGPFFSALFNLSLIVLFGLQHSIMARSGFKKWWTKIVPEPVERSTYVLIASVLLLIVFVYWQPIPIVIWSFQNRVIEFGVWSLYAIGWIIGAASTYMIDHFELFGLRQVYSVWSGATLEAGDFQTPWLYKYVRHPIMLGFLIVFWATPRMTVGHFLFSTGMSVYILIGVYYEEKDLIVLFGEKYKRYRTNVPSLVPFLKNPFS